ncbi:MAG: hypothetical protein J6Y11_03285 [Paludibacteraceae bacterium]|nr:hypothetical protein [Paludibacteraceae bacterium]
MKYLFFPLYFLLKLFPSDNQGKRIAGGIAIVLYDGIFLLFYYVISVAFSIQIGLFSNLLLKFLLVVISFLVAFYEFFDCLMILFEKLDRDVFRTRSSRIIGGLLTLLLFGIVMVCVINLPPDFWYGHKDYPLFERLKELLLPK